MLILDMHFKRDSKLEGKWEEGDVKLPSTGCILGPSQRLSAVLALLLPHRRWQEAVEMPISTFPHKGTLPFSLFLLQREKGTNASSCLGFVDRNSWSFCWGLGFCYALTGSFIKDGSCTLVGIIILPKDILCESPRWKTQRKNRAESLHGCPSSSPLETWSFSAEKRLCSLKAEIWSSGKAYSQTQLCGA